MNQELRFSIVMPVYNRATLVRRAVASCLQQQHPAFEVIVVDDGSIDGTAESVAALADPRLRLIVQPVNRGVSPARNLAVEHARGEWIVCLDSDDELIPGALDRMDADIRLVTEDVQAFRFMCRLDDGSVSPEPPLQREIWDYEGFLRWAEQACLHGPEQAVLQETVMCVRRCTFESVRFPEGWALETLYNLDFASRFRTATSPSVVRLYHNDSPDQLTRPNVARMLAAAADHARSFETLLDRHGAALSRWAPGLLMQYTRGLATQQFLAGKRLSGFRTIVKLIRAGGGSLNASAVLLLGMIGRRSLAKAKAHRMQSGFAN